MDSVQDKPAVALQQLSVGYARRTPLLEGVTAAIPPGTLTALIGRNGSGKSTLLRVLAGLDAPRAGSVSLQGRPLAQMRAAERARRVAFVATQRPHIAAMRCRDLVALGRAPYTSWAGRMSADDERRVDHALALTSLTPYAHRHIDTLSDGECQRVMIARALAQDTPLLILDEPTSFLDIPARREVCALLERLAREEGKTVIFSTHELDLALQTATYIALLDTPRLHLLPTEQMRSSGLIRRLFAL